MDPVYNAKGDTETAEHSEGRVLSSKGDGDGFAPSAEKHLDHGIDPINAAQLPKGYYYSPLILGTFFVSKPQTRSIVSPR